MGLQLEVFGTQISFKVEEFGVIRGYEFGYSVSDSGYSKGHRDERVLIIKASISRTLTIYPDVLKQVRKWAKIEYKDADTYYHYVKITHIHREELIRYIIFPNAFVKNFTEEIDPHTGDGIYTITLMQKLDKRIDIEVGPFNEVHPRLSSLLEKSSQKREAQRLAAAAALAGSFANKPPNNKPLNSPPYWVERKHLVSSNIRIINPVSMYRGPSLNSGVIPNSLIQSNSNAFIPVIRARRDESNILWYLINSPSSLVSQGWIPGVFRVSATVEGIGTDTPNVSAPRDPATMIVMADEFTGRDGGPNSIREVWGGTDSLPRTSGQRQTPENFASTIATPAVNAGGAKQVGNDMGLVDGTIVHIAQPANPIFSPRSTREWVQVSRWQAGAAIILSTVMDYEAMDRVELAQEILRRHYNVINNAHESEPRIYLRELTNPPPALTDENGRSSYANIRNTANGEMAITRTTLNDGRPVPNTELSEDLLRAILRINDRFGTIAVNTIAGGDHTQSLRDEHYLGLAADFTVNATVTSTRGAGVVQNNITMGNRLEIIEYLQDKWGFITQRNRKPDIHFSVAPQGYLGSGHFHISIFGRKG